MVNFIDFYFHFLANFQTYVTQTVSLGDLWYNAFGLRVS